MLDDSATVAPFYKAESGRKPTVDQLLTQFEVEQFFFLEAALLDQRRFDEWLGLFSQDVLYWVPIRRTKTLKERATEFTGPSQMSFMKDNLALLTMRVQRLKTGYAWAEDPPSRVRRMLSNIRIVAMDKNEMEVEVNFRIYRSRLEHDVDEWVGYRHDRLRREGDGLKICQRSVFLEHTVLTSPNLSTFF